MLIDVNHILPSAVYEIVRGRFEVVAPKVAIGFFGAVWMVPWGRVDKLAATVILVRHDRQQVSMCSSYNLFERSELLCG